MSTRAAVWRSALILLAASVAVSAQSEQRPVFRAGVEIARVSVRVLDKERRPVRGLEAKDFTVLVNGVAQPVVTTYADDFGETLPVAGWRRDVASDVATNATANARLIVIILDDALFSAGSNDPFQLKQTKAVARAIIAELHPSDLVAVCFSLDAGESQDFTTDRQKLLAAVDKFHASAITPQLAVAYSITMLQEAMRRLSEVPERASAVMWVSIGTGTNETLGQGLVNAVRRTQSRTHFALVPVYPISTVGLQAPVPRYIRQDRSRARAMRGIALATGGRAIANTNAPVDLIPAIMQEAAVRYTVGFTPTYMRNDGKYKKIHVRVNRPGLLIEPSDGLVLSLSDKQLAEEKAKAQRVLPTTVALSGILPMADEPLRLAVASFATPASASLDAVAGVVAVTLGVSLPGRGASSAAEATLDIEVRLFDGEGGRQLDERHHSLHLGRAPSGGARPHDVLSTLTMKPGRYNLRVSTHHRESGTRSSIYTDVTVPDYADAPLSMSGVVVSATPGPRATPALAFEHLLPITPTTAREFSPADRATAFLRVYWGGDKVPVPVSLHAVILNAAEGSVFDRRTDLTPVASPTSGALRTADYRLDLPLAGLAGGDYLLTLRAVPGKGAEIRRDVRFTIR